MKIFVEDKPIAQGELLIVRVESLPDGLVPVATKNKVFIVGHSETGCHHVIKEQDGVTIYANDNDKWHLYLVVNNPKESVELEHLRSFDTHKSFFFKDGVYKIRKQWEDDGVGLVPALD